MRASFHRIAGSVILLLAVLGNTPCICSDPSIGQSPATVEVDTGRERHCHPGDDAPSPSSQEPCETGCQHCGSVSALVMATKALVPAAEGACPSATSLSVRTLVSIESIVKLHPSWPDPPLPPASLVLDRTSRLLL